MLFRSRAIKVLGARRWQLLHKLVYGEAELGILHFFWMRAGKNNFAEVLVYAAILAALLGWRLVELMKKKTKKSPSNINSSLSTR